MRAGISRRSVCTIGAAALLAAALLLTLLPLPGSAQAQTKDELDLLAMVDWARTQPTTHPMLLDAHIADAFGFGNNAIQTKQWALTNPAAGLSVALDFAQIHGHDLWVLQYTKGPVSILWRVAHDGTVLNVVRAAGDVTRLPRDAQNDKLQFTRTVLLRKFHKESVNGN